MKINRFTNLIRIVFYIILTIVTMFVIMAMILDLLINGEKTIFVHLFLLFLICCASLFAELIFIVLNKYSKNSIVFSCGYISYRKQKYSVDTLSLRYFKFQWTFLDTDLVIPKLVISTQNGETIICYINKKQLKRLKNEINYNIKEI